MIVTDEDVADVCHRKPHQLHSGLCPFATIEHEVFAAHIQYLRSRLVTSGGLCRAAAQYVQFKWFHDLFLKEKPPPLNWGRGIRALLEFLIIPLLLLQLQPLLRALPLPWALQLRALQPSW